MEYSVQQYLYVIQQLYNLSGGGLYDEEGRENKIGNWIEINDDFSDWSQVNFKGMYKNGVKVGQWDIWSKDANTELIQIGGGTYDEESKGLKVGNWTEITDGFKHITQVTYNGVYKNGIKVGKWEIWGRKDFEHQKIEMIGGGDYDENGLGVKKGKWIEICDGFIYSENIAYIGIYENGKKIGIWVEVDVDTQEELNKINYDQ
ncbi:unnamed protein product [Paramecium octaurelia]|uniref:Uncharacterized protein n=1 Tax=Paramecium octaurelia TaxID=43137 RepID=A0A8S1TZ14_PAROT|nr:unnamed protein product [Paramecium octaurelia]